MKVWVVKEESYDFDSSYTRIVAVFDSEEKANAYKESQEQHCEHIKKNVEKCRSCPLLEDIDSYIYQCYTNKVSPDVRLILQKEKDCKENKCIFCSLDLSYDDDQVDQVLDYVTCSYAENLYMQDMYSYLYEVVPMEVK